MGRGMGRGAMSWEPRYQYFALRPKCCPLIASPILASAHLRCRAPSHKHAAAAEACSSGQQQQRRGWGLGGGWWRAVSVSPTPAAFMLRTAALTPLSLWNLSTSAARLPTGVCPSMRMLCTFFFRNAPSAASRRHVWCAKTRNLTSGSSVITYSRCSLTASACGG